MVIETVFLSDMILWVLMISSLSTHLHKFLCGVFALVIRIHSLFVEDWIHMCIWEIHPRWFPHILAIIINVIS